MEEARVAQIVAQIVERVVAVLPIFEPITAAWCRAYWLQALVEEELLSYHSDTMVLLEAELSVAFPQQSIQVVEVFLVEAHRHQEELLVPRLTISVLQDLWVPVELVKAATIVEEAEEAEDIMEEEAVLVVEGLGVPATVSLDAPYIQ
jgi:hypothetical protein